MVRLVLTLFSIIPSLSNLQTFCWVFRENQVNGDQTDLRENLVQM